MRWAQTRENASIHLTRAGDGSSGLVFTSSDGRPVAVAVLAPVSFAVDVGGGCSTTTGISVVTPASAAPAAISAVTAAAAAGGGGLYNNKSNA